MYLHTFLDTYPHMAEPLKNKLGSTNVQRIIDEGPRVYQKMGYEVVINPHSWIPQEGEEFYVHRRKSKDDNTLTLTFLQNKKENVP